MFCAISGHVPEAPVASAKSGHVFEKSLIEKYIESTGKCPITAEPLALSDLLPLKTSSAVKPRPPTATSIPTMLSLLHAEWDALMLESFELKSQLDTARQELAHTLYQHDASCRVIARLIAERDQARQALETAATSAPTAVAASAAQAQAQTENGSEPATKRARSSAAPGPAPVPTAAPTAGGADGGDADGAGADAPTVSGSLPEALVELFDGTFKRLAQGRKKRKPPPSHATAVDLAAYVLHGKSSLESLGDAAVTAADLLAADSPAAPAAPADGVWAAAMVVGGSDGSLRLADARKGSSLRAFAAGAEGGGHGAAVAAVAVGQGAGAGAVLSGDRAGVVKLWRLESSGGDAVPCAHTWTRHSASATAVALHPAGGHGFSASADGSFALLDFATGAIVATAAFAGGSHAIGCAALHPDGLFFATGTAGGHVRIWDVKSLTNAATFDVAGGADGARRGGGGGGAGVRALTFSENGYHLAGAGDDGLVKVWDLRKLSVLATLGEAGRGVSSLRSDACGIFLAAAGASGLRVFSAKTWEPLCGADGDSLGDGGALMAGFAPHARAIVGVTSKEAFACAAPDA